MVDTDVAGAATPLPAIWFGAFLATDPLFDGWAVESLHSSLPAWTSYLFAAATLFGEPWVFVPVLATAYWFGDPDRIASLFGLVFGGLALAVVLKAALALPRPPTGPMIQPEAAHASLRDAYAWTIHATGHGFPSAHALGAVLTWGALAGALRVGSRRARIGVATALVVLTAASRVGLGVHYAVDVAGGALVGLALLFGWRAARCRMRRPVTVTLAAGVACAVIPVALGVGGDDALYALGALLGCLVTWLAVGPPRRPFRPSLAGAGVAVAGIVWFLGAGVAVGSLLPGAVGSMATTAVMGVAIFSWPAAVGAARGRIDRVRSHG